MFIQSRMCPNFGLQIIIFCDASVFYDDNVNSNVNKLKIGILKY